MENFHFHVEFSYLISKSQHGLNETFSVCEVKVIVVSKVAVFKRQTAIIFDEVWSLGFWPSRAVGSSDFKFFTATYLERPSSRRSCGSRGRNPPR